MACVPFNRAWLIAYCALSARSERHRIRELHPSHCIGEMYAVERRFGLHVESVTDMKVTKEA